MLRWLSERESEREDLKTKFKYEVWLEDLDQNEHKMEYCLS